MDRLDRTVTCARPCCAGVGGALAPLVLLCLL